MTLFANHPLVKEPLERPETPVPSAATFEIIAPVDLTNHQQRGQAQVRWALFEHWVERAQELGVQAIQVPIVWNKVEGENKSTASGSPSPYDWTYYRQIVEVLSRHQLRFVPAFAFHLCGNPYGHNMHPLPAWLWGRLLAEHPQLSRISDLQYVSETGASNDEYTSLWIDEFVLPYYIELMTAFKHEFADQAHIVSKILVSMGPNSELRYPSYNYHDWGDFPNRGTIQAYSTIARRSLQAYVQDKYQDPAAAAEAWDRPVDSFQQISLPADADELFAENAYRSDRYSQDVLTWYHEQLVGHGRRLLRATAATFNDQGFEAADIAFRLPGVHWHITHPDTPRAAEITAGLIKPHADLSYEDHGEYLELLTQVIPAELRPRTVVHVTAAERENRDEDGYSRAADLVGWITDAAAELDVRVIGENSWPETIHGQQSWDQLEKHLLDDRGLVGLSIHHLESMMGEPEISRTRLADLIQRMQAGDTTYQPRAKEFRVMGPLHLKVLNEKQVLTERDWYEFDRQLKTLRRIGVTAVSIDIWWGLVEGRREGEFDWRYYDRVVRLLRANGLHWVPIISFHQAGGNVNDDFTQMIPLWLWGKIVSDHDELQAVQDIQYVSETGDASIEYVALWADQYVMPYYRRFLEAFRDHFRRHASIIDELNLSLGPAGELRYPSYNAHDWGSYPNRGTLQCYSRLAHRDFHAFLASSYEQIADLNEAWESDYETFESIAMPRADDLFSDQAYMRTRAGWDFFYWYSDALVQHGKRLLNMADEVFQEWPFKQIPLGIKLPGIHWHISDPEAPRAAEVTAGLIMPHVDLGPHNQDEYLHTIQRMLDQPLRERVTLHFTCLEMVNKDYEGYSRAADLVTWVAAAAKELGLPIMGENALAGELFHEQGWQQMGQALTRDPGYTGLTVLRMQHLFSGQEFPLDQLREMIRLLR